MSVKHEVIEVQIKARVPVRTCDGCGKPDTDAGAIQVFARDGEVPEYEATRARAPGWNEIWIGESALDACPACCAGLVLAGRRRAKPDANGQDAAREPKAEPPTPVAIDAPAATEAAAK